jgi:uncharacterized protein YehS (DUF1456 family)
VTDTDMVKIFELGGVELTAEEVRKLHIKSKETNRYNNVVDRPAFLITGSKFEVAKISLDS